VVSSVQHGDCQALVDAFIDGEPPLAADAIGRCWGSADELAATAYSHAARLLLGEMANGLDDGPGPWLVRWERAVRAVVAAMRRRPGLADITLSEQAAGSDAICERRMLYRRQCIDLLTSAYVRDREADDTPDLHVELIAGVAYRAYVAEAAAGRLTDPHADVVPRLVSAVAILEPVPA
jgi:hypothetical protein